MFTPSWKRKRGRPVKRVYYSQKSLRSNKKLQQEENETEKETVDLTSEPGEAVLPANRIVGMDNGTNLECKIISGTISQSNSKFSDDSRGRQCTAISCVALAYLNKKKILNIENNVEFINWITEDLDKIINLGDFLYNVSVKQMKQNGKNCSEFLSFDEVFSYIEIENQLYHFFSITPISTNIDSGRYASYIKQNDCWYKNLKSDLNSLLNININKVIFTCNGFTFGIIFEHGKYILFDSHERRTDGFPINEIITEGAAVLCINKHVDGLIFRLMYNCGLLRRYKMGEMGKDSHLILYSLTSVWVEQEISTQNKAQFLRIKRILKCTEKLTQEAEQKKFHRHSESLTHTSERLSIEKKRSQCSRSHETEEQKSVRLADKRERSEISRSHESEEQK